MDKNTQSGSRRTLLFIALIVVAGCFVYLIFGKGKRERRMNYDSDREYMLGKKKLEELKARGIRKDTPRFEYGKATKADIEDWKQQVQKSFKEQERKSSEQEFLRHQEKTINDDKPKGGLFSMFGQSSMKEVTDAKLDRYFDVTGRALKKIKFNTKVKIGKQFKKILDERRRKILQR